MDVIEKARELGAMLQQDERYTKYVAAKEVNDNDEELQKLINEFNMKRIQLNSEMSKPEKDEERLKEYDGAIKKLYGEIMSNQSMAVYNEAKNEMDKLLGQINMVITYCANGEDPATCPTEETHSCSGSCESCGGCH